MAAGAPALSRLRKEFAGHGRELVIDMADSDSDLLLVHSPQLGPDAYDLEVSSEQVTISASTPAGFHYGLSTLSQWIRAAAWRSELTEVRCVRIQDQPDFEARGFSIDVARDKRPTMQVLFEIVERFSSWKYNQMQLYMEADFAYSGAAQVLAERSPYTPEEMRALDQHCRSHHVELIPNQQSFGHMHAWLRHDRWRHLAEVPEGLEHPFSRNVEPFSLAANSAEAISFLDGLYSELLPCFTSGLVNVGLDETFDLGKGRSARACQARGQGTIYLDHLNAVHRLAKKHGKRIQFWGDIVLEHPQLLANLPTDATALVWGYEADFPFEERLPAFAASGLAFQVCPGTSSWNSFGGRISNCLGNLKKAAREALEHGAQGLLVTDWGDRGHLQPLPTGFFGYLCGASCAWNATASQDLELPDMEELLSLHAFDDPSGQLAKRWNQLGLVTDVLGDRCENGHALFFASTFADSGFPPKRVVGLDANGLAAVRDLLDAVLAEPQASESTRPDSLLLEAELRVAHEELSIAELHARARMALSSGNSIADLPPATRSELRARLDQLCELYAQVWSQRYRPGGLAASLSWLDFLGDC